MKNINIVKTGLITNDVVQNQLQMSNTQEEVWY